MNHTIEGSKNIEVVCLGWTEDLEKLESNEKGFTAGKSARKSGKESSIENIQEIQVGKIGDAKLFENGSLELENGQRIDKFADYKEIKRANSERMTEFAIKSKEAGMGRN